VAVTIAMNDLVDLKANRFTKSAEQHDLSTQI